MVNNIFKSYWFVKENNVIYNKINKSEERNMIVDREGNLFEDRRKNDDRRKRTTNVNKDKRKTDRRKEEQRIKNK